MTLLAVLDEADENDVSESSTTDPEVNKIATLRIPPPPETQPPPATMAPPKPLPRVKSPLPDTHLAASLWLL